MDVVYLVFTCAHSIITHNNTSTLCAYCITGNDGGFVLFFKAAASGQTLKISNFGRTEYLFRKLPPHKRRKMWPGDTFLSREASDNSSFALPNISQIIL